jgi:hypothetical protein
METGRAKENDAAAVESWKGPSSSRNVVAVRFDTSFGVVVQFGGRLVG